LCCSTMYTTWTRIAVRWTWKPVQNEGNLAMCATLSVCRSDVRKLTFFLNRKVRETIFCQSPQSQSIVRTR
jgi:hypothetical protein